MKRFPILTRIRFNSSQSTSGASEPTFSQLYFNYMKKLGATSVVLYIAYDQLSVPVVGRSMTPQFNPNFADYGDTVFFLPRILKSEKLKRGKIYLFNDPTKTPENMQEFDTEYCIKRCIAIEGDTVMYERVLEGGETEVVHLVVPEGHSWLESDNHNFQAGQLPDSLLFGPIANENIWGRVIWCVRKRNLFPTLIPYPQNYDWNIELEDALPHQRLIFAKNIENLEMNAIHKYKNLPNKLGMSKLPKGPADRKMETMTSEQKLGYATRHDFNLESDKKYLEKLKKEKEDHIEGIDPNGMVPGMPITERSQAPNTSQYPNLN